MSVETAVAASAAIDPKVYEWMLAFLGGIEQVRAGMDMDRLIIERTTEFESFTDGTVLDRRLFSVTLTNGVWVNKYGTPMRRMGVLLDYASGRAVKRPTT
jgi:hypothetical protein